MNDILPPKRPLAPPTPPVAPLPVPVELRTEPQSVVSTPEKQKMSVKKKLMLWTSGIVVCIVAAIVGCVTWYELSLMPVSTKDTSRTRIEVATGDSPTEIGQLLASKKLIRSATAFDIYTRLSHMRDKLQAGTYSLSPSESTADIVKHIASGKVDQFNITFLPGATLTENRAALIKAGYKEADVDAAFKKTYDSPLFADKPATADLEGYIYGETYNFDSSATVEQVLSKTFDEYEGVIRDNNLVEGFRRQGLTLYQGVTLASIIQREVPGASDQKQVAQIFLKRYALNMPLGSDMTAYYGAENIGATKSVAVDTPYNTRLHPGLPPGPIGSPGLSALEAVASPANGDFLFFLSGDDDVTYYARTDEEHEANIRDHCKIKCAVQ